MPLSNQQTTEIKQQYDPLRKRAQQQEAATLQTQNDSIARRSAQLGGGPSGAMMKQESLAQDSSAKRLQDANEGINAQQTGAINQAREVQAQREYQTSEREAGQKFATGERAGTQTFQAGQNKAAMDQQLLMQKNQIEAAASEGRLTREQADKQLAEMQRQYDKDYQANENTNIINTLLSGFNSGIDPNQIGHLLGALGYTNIQGIPGLTYMPNGGGAAPAAGTANAQPAAPNAKPKPNYGGGGYGPVNS